MSTAHPAPVPAEEPLLDAKLRARTRRDIALYALARFGLFLVLTAIIQALAVLLRIPVPLVVSALLALLVAFPLSLFVFRGLRLRVTEEIAAWDAQRKAHKQWVSAQLAGRN